LQRASLEFQRNPTGYLLRCAETLGTVADVTPSATLLTDPRDIAFVLAHTGDIFSLTHNLLGQPVTERHPAEWNAGRRAVSASLRPAVETLALRAISDGFDRLRDEWPSRPVDDGIDRFERATGAIIGRVCFGVDAARFDALTRDVLASLSEASLKSFDPPSWAPVRIRAARRARRLRAEIRAAVDDRRAAAGGADLAGLLIAPDVGGLSPEMASRMLVSVMLAGYGVPALALAWTIFLLDKYPQERQKVAEEVHGAPLDSPHASLPVTDAATREALRLYPPTWLLARKLLCAQTINGREFKEGHVFYMSSFLTARNGAYYEHPKAFVPSRWHNEPFIKQLPRYAYFPFGGGSGFCLGASLARLEVRMLTALLVRECRLAVVEPEQVRLSSQRGLRPLNLTLVRDAW
jgi:cytochrome P450